MKTVKREEPIARSRFVDCPVCNNHTLKLKRVVQVGRCKSCSETYKIIVVYVKSGRRTKLPVPSSVSQPEKSDTVPDLALPSWQLPSDSSLFGTSDYSGLSDLGLGEGSSEKKSESGSSSDQ